MTAKAWIGPVNVDLVEPQLTVTANPTALGIQQATITALVEWTKNHQLRELANNPHRRITVGGQSGVLETVWFDDDGQLEPLNGWALLQPYQLGQADQSHSLQGSDGFVPYTLSAAFLGAHRQAVVARSARPKGNDYHLTAHSIVVDPFGADDFAVAPVPSGGGTMATREYDTVHPRDLTIPSSTSGAVVLYDGSVRSTDRLAAVVLPQLPVDDALLGAPPWVTARGGDCRGIDRREEREVYGPSHPTKITSDLGITNGLVSFWVGNKGIPPFLNLQAFSAGGWHEVGCVVLNTIKSLLGARLVKVTPDETTIALLVQSFGECFVTLKRGERMLRFQCPAGLTPTWSGTPAASRAVRAINWTGKFGQGLDGGGAQTGTWSAPFPTWSGDARYTWSGLRNEPDIRLRWPALVKNEGTTVLWYRADRASSALTAGAGFLTVFDQNGAWVGQLWLDTSGKLNFQAGSHVVQSSVITFAANDFLMLAVRWSSTNGITLSVRTPDGTVSHFSDPTATAPGTDAPYDVSYYVNFTRWGDGSWGDGEWGGITLYPEGTIDNHGLWRRRLTNAEVEALATAAYGLDKLPKPQGDLVWFAPFDVAPIVSLPAMSGGRQVDPVTDSWGFQRVIAALNAELDGCAAYLARSEPLGDVIDQHQQFAAEFDQKVRVR